MTIIAVIVHELDNEVWLSCYYDNFPYNESASSYYEAEAKLRRTIARKHGLKPDDLEFEKVNATEIN